MIKRPLRFLRFAQESDFKTFRLSSNVYLAVSLAIIVIIVAAALLWSRNQKEGFDGKGSDELYFSESTVHGTGLFTKRGFRAGELVLVAIEPDQQITHQCSKVNHCVSRANLVLREGEPGYWNLHALRDLEKGEELLTDYNNTPDFIAKPDPSWTC
jgi:preprotein translocase subunit Sec61beta